MSKGVKVLLTILIIALALDLALIFLQRWQAAQTGSRTADTAAAGGAAEESISAESTPMQSDAVFNFIDETSEPADAAAQQSSEGLSEEEMGAMALSEESDEEWPGSAD